MNWKTYFEIRDPESLRIQMRKGCLPLAVTASIALSIIFGIASRSTAGILVLWAGLFPAFWVGLRFACLMAWDNSFKKHTRFTISASPRAVMIASVVFTAPATMFHSAMTGIAFASAGWPAGGAFIILGIPIYIFAMTIGLYVIYLPILLAVKLFVAKTSNSADEMDAAKARRPSP